MMGKRGTLRRHRYDERVTMLGLEGLRLVVKLTLRMGIGQARRGLLDWDAEVSQAEGLAWRRECGAWK